MPSSAYFTSKMQSWEVVAGMPVGVVLHKPGRLSYAVYVVADLYTLKWFGSVAGH